MRSKTSFISATPSYGWPASPPSCPRKIGPCVIPQSSSAAGRSVPSTPPGDLAPRRPSIARQSTIRTQPADSGT